MRTTGLDIPKVKSVTQIDGKWALEIEYKDGKTMEDMMNSDKKNIEKYMEDFVDLQSSDSRQNISSSERNER